MKPSKVLCCMFLLHIWGVDPAKKQEKYKKWLCACTTNQIEALYYYERLYIWAKKQKMCRVKDLLTTTLASFFDVYWAS